MPSCRRGRRLNVVGVAVDDYGASVDRQPRDPVTRLLGDKWSRYEAVTSVIGYTGSDAIVRSDYIDRAREVRCSETQYTDLHEGAMTTAGLLVEMRSRVALVQPNHGPAIWVPVGKLQLAGVHPGCDSKPAVP